MGVPELQTWEILLGLIYALLAIGLSQFVSAGKLRQYFVYGLGVRLFGAITFMAIYLFYYKGGDTIAYYQTGAPFIRLLLSDPTAALGALVEPYSLENYSLFTAETGFPLIYIYGSSDTFNVVRFITPLLLLSFNSYFISTILMSALTFYGPWKLFKTFRRLFPGREKIVAFSTLFFPSVIFWGSGISKDTITFSSLCLVVHFIHEQILCKRYHLPTMLLSALALILIVVIKPYIFLVLLPSSAIWILFSRIQKIKNRILRLSIAPLIFLLGIGIVVLAIVQFDEYLGDYSMNKIIDKAIVTQEDLKRDYYGGNSFDIGVIEPSFLGILSKFPIATFYGFFGPTVLQIRNVVSLFSAIENTYLMLLVLAVVYRSWRKGLLSIIANEPFYLFCFSFSVFIAFGIGLTTANFGALVRFKIPLLPLFNMALLALYFNLKPKPPHE